MKMKLELQYCLWIIILLKNSSAKKDIIVQLHKYECGNPCTPSSTKGSHDIIFGVQIIASLRKNITICQPIETTPQDADGGYCEECQYAGHVADYKDNNNISFSDKMYSTNDTTILFKVNQNHIAPVYVYAYITRYTCYTQNIQDDWLGQYCDIYNTSTRIWGMHSLKLKQSCNCSLYFSLNYTCSEHYYGEKCDVFCIPHNDDSGHYSCDENGTKTCIQDYSGDNCTVYDFCSSSPCGNNGTCRSTTTDYSCFCSNGYTGKNCSTNIDECASNPCVNGSCIDLVDSFLCNCILGYNGTFCEKNIDECSNVSCHYGTCIDGLNNYTCNCEDGYTGKNCESSINDCIQNNCVNGTCVDGYRNYTCLCKAGFTGSLCDTRIDVCLNNVCVHGTCIDTMDNPPYFCDCDSKFTGTFCDIEIEISTELVDIKPTMTKLHTEATRLNNQNRTELTYSSMEVISTEPTNTENNKSDLDASKDLLSKNEVKYPLIAAGVVVVAGIVIAAAVCYKRRNSIPTNDAFAANINENGLLKQREDFQQREDLKHSNGVISTPSNGFGPGDRGSNSSIVSKNSSVPESQNEYVDEMSHL